MEIKCEHCGHIAATLVAGKLVVHEGGMPIRLIDKEKNIGDLECPKCGEKTRLDISFMKKY